MTIAAVVYAYLSDSMPEIILSETDKRFISDFQAGATRLRGRKPFQILFRGGSRLWGFTRLFLEKLLPHSNKTQRGTKLTRAQREEAVTRFILALSDQQLAVGLAIMVATIANQCTLSVAEFRIAFALAWFSTTTHLATLDSLRHYFLSHKTIRNWRILGMVILLVLFVYCFIVILLVANASETSIPVQCHISRQVETGFGADPISALNIAAWIITFSVVMSGYKSRIFHSYGFHSSGSYGNGLLSAKLQATFGRSKTDLSKTTLAEWCFILNEATKEKWGTTQVRLLRRISEPGASNMFVLRKLLIRRNLAVNMYSRSLLPVIPSLAFMFVYGLTQMISNRWKT